MNERLVELEICFYHEDEDAGQVKAKNADLTKLKGGWAFKSDFNPHVLPAIPKLAIQQVIKPHNPGQEPYEAALYSLSANSTPRSNDFYEDQEDLNDT